jgi:hypothetical protein
MKKVVFSLFMLFAFVLFGHAQVFTEQFNYAVGSTLDSNGWNQHSGTTDPISVGASSLSFAQYSPNPVGGSAVSTGTSQDVNTYFGPISSGNVYASFLLKLDTVNSDGYFFHFMDSSGTTASYRARTYFRQDADNANAFNVGLSFSSGSATFDTTEFMYGSTLLIVTKYAIIGGASTQNDEVSLYAFDASGSFMTEPATPLIGPIVATHSEISPARLALRQFSGNAGYTVDEFSVDTVWNMMPFGAAGPPSPYCNTQVYHFQDPNQTASSVFLTIQSTGPNSLEVIVESATADPVKDLVIAGAAGGAMFSPIDSSVAGQYKRTLSWTNAPTTAAFNVLWGKRNTPGLWQLVPGAGQLNWTVAAVCTGGPPPPMKSPIDLPITWDDTANVNYAVTDFGGGTSSMLAPDPANSSNLVLMTVKDTLGAPWSGTTLSTASGLANAIPFASGATTLKALVYAPDTGLTVRIKVEDKSNSAIFMEVDAITQVANAWDTLTFDFTTAWVSGNTYDLISIFYNFNVLPASAQTFYLDDVYLDIPPSAPVSPYCNTQVYHFQNPAEVASSIFMTIQNTGANSMEVIIESATADPVDELIIAGGSGAAISPIDSSVAGQYKRTLSWAANTPDTAVFNVLWSKDNFPGNWQYVPAAGQLSFPVAATCPSAPPPMKAQIDLPITWDDTANVDYTVTDFGGGTTSVLAADPANSSNLVLMTVKDTAGAPWSGTTLSTANGFATAIPFAPGATTLKALVYAPDTGITVRLKVEDKTTPSIFVELDATTQVANAWDTLSFDFSAGVNFANTYDLASVFYNFNVLPTSPETYYLDDVYLDTGSGGPVLAQIDLPITWDDTANVDYTVTDFAGNASMLVPSPTNAANLVLSSTKDTAAANFAGTTLSTANGLANPIPFTGSGTTISAIIYSPDANITVRLKAENKNNSAIFVEAEALTTVANAWDTLVFDFANNVSPPVLDTTVVYDLLSIFYDFNMAPANPAKTYYLDDVFFGGVATGPVLSQIDLPITWDDSTVNYTVADFGGNVSTRITDPMNAGNMILQSIKTTGSQTFAGTTLSTATGLANPIPFTATATTLSAVVYSPKAGIPVVVKAEDATNGAIFVETGVVTSVANSWDTLVFDFSTPLNGSLNLANTYDKISIFYDFNTAGVGDTFYLDDVFFGGTATSGPSTITFQVDMSGYSGSFTQPEINGTFNGFCGTCNPLTDPDGDNIWETTITLLAAEIEYLFTHDNFTGAESFPKINPPACTKTTFSPPDTFVNRFLVLTGDTVLPPVCWESCSPCTGPPANANVTFQVDMSEYTGSYGQVNLNGTFNGFCGTCAVMTDANNDSIFELTVTVPTDTIEYLFTLDGFTVAESFEPGDPCTITTIAPPDTFVNRYFVPTADTTLPVVCFNSCSACSGIGIDENNWINDVVIAPNPTEGIVHISASLAATSTTSIEVVDVHGRTIYQVEQGGARLNERIDLSKHAPGMYFVRISSRFGMSTYKVVKTR